ncbi:MAG: Sortase (Surface protein transpeptidase) [Candidatus Collierbacteria bacterium GW2011_GWD2_45_10]|uniref:Sortase (Surface protein transpeptidase) n=1 Tax=Candidatus Collierbacteria bacterium GW2011_GWB2_44_22 TaxID=1618387 RepID=A0A0G1I0E3_9BACT|nr:MAG: Sortase (Surface protein transpeptidase) [Candidatus Collierbacteria bacterium GW2011_GWA2_44_13]KKT49418.1 MAG: Sortase (Surface protein transpeptidase) [Candidatus Collierbacteria bacterium GW2011_GWB1_44_197]KKT52293.1 MAG: Sortase (Surface protein transpeptidase) [Candidatus Collierbacteria bacterium GW2011_GWB2_44_22]KKT63213.1 MAG: Sortase (Surface protein transpeptidase) [Candidatus Collierbacteria bacterium GW2011_GWD1_44_27]KKT66123.1 MAG: Sortase (Surface protein transpeptidas
MSKDTGKPLILIAFLSLATSLLIVFFPSSQENNHPTGQVAGISTAALPVRLIIPSINVDTTIQYVGINSEGEMATPSSAYEVGWFKLGTIPGEVGNAVIAGHFDDKDGLPGIFANLSKLNKGDKLYVTNNQGRLVTFSVREARISEPGYVEEVFVSSDSAHLNLVTCRGVWSNADKSYSERLIVFADKDSI